MTNVSGAATAEHAFGHPTHGDDPGRPEHADQAIQEDEAGVDLLPDWPPIRWVSAGIEWVRWNRIPQDDPVLETEFFQDAMNDRPRRFLPWARPARRAVVWLSPGEQVEFAGEGDAGPAHPLVARGLADRQDVRLGSLEQVVAEVGEPDRRRIRDVIGS
jgi:hypothetical protein